MSEDTGKRATRQPTGTGTEGALRDSQRLLTGIIESAMDAIITIDADHAYAFSQKLNR